jgi:riboflavin kinase/FMN adenylyltransferase
MKLIRCGVDTVLQDHSPCVATIGTFDGLHIGHQSVIRMLKEESKRVSLPTMVLTFEPTPQEFFLKEKAAMRLTCFREKFEILQTMVVDIMCVLRFNASMALLSAKDFIRLILVEKLLIKHLVIGEDFRFGKGRTGDISLLQTEGNRLGFQVTVVPLLSIGGHKVGSSAIRDALADGRKSDAEKWLGRKVK